MSNKQTSIEWLRQELWEQFKFSFSDNIFEQAKEMHKAEIIDAVNGYTTTELLGVTKGEYYYTENYTENYTEFDVSKGSDKLTKEIIDFMKKEKKLKQQLPQQEISDEEIEKGAEDWQEFRQGAGKQSFEAGAKWYREQLKQK